MGVHQQAELDVFSLNKHKGFLKSELQLTSFDLKELKQDFKTFEARHSKIEGKLSDFERVTEQLQSEVKTVK